MALGPSGAADYVARLNFATTIVQNQSQTLAAWLPNLQLARAVEAAVAIWTLCVAWRLRSRGPQVTIAVALVGGLAASPYVHYDDLAMLGLACLLFVSTTRGRWAWAYAVGLVVAGEGFPVWGAGPVIAGELLALLVLSVPALEHHYSDAQQDRSEREHDPHLETDGQNVAADGHREAIDHGRLA